MSDYDAKVDEHLHQRIDWNMTNHAPHGDSVVERFEALRTFAKQFSHAIVDLCPDGRDRSLALTHAEDALMRAVAAIARNQDAMVGSNMPAEDPSGLTQEQLQAQRDEEAEMAEVRQDTEPPFATSDDLEVAAADALAPREQERETD